MTNNCDPEMVTELKCRATDSTVRKRQIRVCSFFSLIHGAEIRTCRNGYYSWENGIFFKTYIRRLRTHITGLY